MAQDTTVARSDIDQRSLPTIIVRLVCPPMVLWLGEASGVQKLKVLKAKRAALSAGASLPALSGAIRKIIPWEEIESRLKS
jgi:hypothetical protein